VAVASATVVAAAVLFLPIQPATLRMMMVVMVVVAVLLMPLREVYSH
jgi:hypothetical protein